MNIFTIRRFWCANNKVYVNQRKQFFKYKQFQLPNTERSFIHFAYIWCSMQKEMNKVIKNGGAFTVDLCIFRSLTFLIGRRLISTTFVKLKGRTGSVADPVLFYRIRIRISGPEQFGSATGSGVFTDMHFFNSEKSHFCSISYLRFNHKVDRGEIRVKSCKTAILLYYVWTMCVLHTLHCWPWITLF